MIILQFKTTTKSDWRSTTNLQHRLNGKPARQHWFENGQKNYEEYYEHNLRHRLNGKPAWQHWYSNGQKRYEEYYEYGELHRLSGKPAWQYWYSNGQKRYEEYYEYGEFIKCSHYNLKPQPPHFGELQIIIYIG